MPEETKSGIESPAGYNGKAPASLKAPTKEYESSSIGDKAKGKSIEGPAQDACYNGKRR